MFTLIMVIFVTQIFKGHTDATDGTDFLMSRRNVQQHKYYCIIKT